MHNSTSSQPAGLISVLSDSSAPFGDRCDAALDLGSFDDPEAEAALLNVVMDQQSDADLADNAGNSLWEIWSRSGKVSQAVVARMHPAARKFFES